MRAAFGHSTWRGWRLARENKERENRAYYLLVAWAARVAKGNKVYNQVPGMLGEAAGGCWAGEPLGRAVWLGQ